MKCSNCGTEILNENINIKADIAQCHQCQHIFKISESLDSEVEDNFDLENPPNGAWIRRESGSVVLGATTRSPIAFFLVPFMIVWSGGSLGGIYGSQLAKGQFDPVSSVFGIPFLMGSVIFWSLALMAIWGKVELRLDMKGGRAFTGLGTIGLSKTFTWDEVSTVKEDKTNYKYPGSQGGVVLLEGKKRVSFGMGVNDSRRYYLYRALKLILSKIKAKKSIV